MKEKIRNFFTYFYIRSEIHESTRLLCELILCALATIIISLLPIKGYYMIALSLLFMVLTLCILFLYFRSSRKRAEYEKYPLYKVNKKRGSIHMDYKDISAWLRGCNDSTIKDMLIDRSREDFTDIIKNFIDNGEAVSRNIETHRTFARVFLQTLRDLLILDCSDELIELAINSVAEDNMPKTHIFEAAKGFSVELRYLGWRQNRLLALRAPLAHYGKWRASFAKAVPYFEVCVKKEEI